MSKNKNSNNVTSVVNDVVKKRILRYKAIENGNDAALQDIEKDLINLEKFTEEVNARDKYHSKKIPLMPGEAGKIFIHPKLSELLGMDKEPDYIINVDPNEPPDFEFKSGEPWPETSNVRNNQQQSYPLKIGEKYSGLKLNKLKMLFGDMLSRCAHKGHVIEVLLHCQVEYQFGNHQHEFTFDVELLQVYEETVRRRESIPEFWYNVSQNMYEYIMERYSQESIANEPFDIQLRFNRTGMFWELNEPKTDFRNY